MSPLHRLTFALRALAVSLALFGPASVIADVVVAPAASAGAPWQKYARGILWRIDAAGVPPSFLFGTLHSDDPRVTVLPAEVKTAFERARSFTLEMVTDDGTLATMAKLMYFDDGRTLPALLGDTLYAQTRKVLRAEGLPHEGIERQKPWVIVMMLSAPRPRHGLFLDLSLHAQASAQSKRIYGLETVAEQLAVFNDLPMPDQIALLRDTLEMHRHARAQLEELTLAYLARDLERIMAIADRRRPADARVYDALMRRLLTERNTRMAERMRARLNEGDAFIAIGAAHLPGRDGLLYLLERDGYRVSPVY